MGYTDITVAHPKELTWIVKSKKKNDKVDSVKLAKLHSVGMIPEAHLLEREDQIYRDLLIQRVKLGAESSKLKRYYRIPQAGGALPRPSRVLRHFLRQEEEGDEGDVLRR